MDDLLHRAQRGDSMALAELVRTHYASVFRFCVRRIGAEAAQDAAQETFVTMQKRLRSFGGKSRFEVWLLGIAHNQCRSLARSSRKDPAPLEDWMAATASPENEIVNREALADALRSLSQDHRDVVILHEIEGLRYAEIAEIVGAPEGTVKSRLHHAFQKLRQAMEVPSR